MFEKFAFRLRHHPLFATNQRVWSAVRPAYKTFLQVLYRKGIPRTLNGTDSIHLDATLHGFPDEYEPEVWRHLMHQIRPDDIFVDVGAHHGLYVITVAKRVASQGHVHAFEPSAENRRILERHILLNGVSKSVTVHPEAVGTYDGTIRFALQGSQSTQVTNDNSDTAEGAGIVESVPSVRLDSVFKKRRCDILKIDVEGFEEQVLLGATALLENPDLRPRHIYIEIHSYAWQTAGTTEASLLNLLEGHGYKVAFLDGRSAENLITYYGEVVATHYSHTRP